MINYFNFFFKLCSLHFKEFRNCYNMGDSEGEGDLEK